jgi:hypothetical protein
MRNPGLVAGTFIFYFYCSGLGIVIRPNLFWCKWLGERKLRVIGKVFCLTGFCTGTKFTERVRDASNGPMLQPASESHAPCGVARRLRFQ